MRKAAAVTWRGMFLSTLLFPTTAVTAQIIPAPTNDALQRAGRLFSAGCPDGERGEIVVCGRSESDRQRVPPTVRPSERSPAATRTSEMENAFAAPGVRQQCGIFSDQRRCSKADMERSGWGGGRDPVTMMRRIIGGPYAVADPVEMENGPPR